MNLANKITMVRMVLIPVFLVVLLSPLVASPMNRYVAAGIFIVASLTDFLDGYIARSQNMVTNFGKFMDPLADKLLVCSALVAMVQLKDLPAWVVILILCREFLVTGFRTLAVEAGLVVAASWWGKAKTSVQMVMIILVLLNLPGSGIAILEQFLIGLAVVLTVVSAIDYLAKNRQVFRG